MKKLTAGIFTVLLATVSMNANAAIPSKQYVDDKVGAEATARAAQDTAINTKIGTVPANSTVMDEITAAVEPKANSSFVGSIPQGSNATTIVGYIDEKVTEAASDASSAISGLNATVSQTAGADGLALQVVETSGKLTSVTGSIAANTYDAYGAAGTAETNAKAYADTLDTAMGTRMTAAEGKITTAETNISNLQAADTAINTKIGNVPANSTVMAEIAAAQSAATYDDTAVKKLISDETSARESADTALDTRVTANKNAIDAINNPTTGIAATAAADAQDKVDALANGAVATNTANIATNTSAISGLDTRMTAAEGDIDALQAADTAINTKIGNVPANSTVMAEIAAAQSAATYDDTALSNRVTANATAISTETTNRTNADTALSGRIDAITAAEDGSDGVQVLTRKVVNGTTTYEWESIERSINNL